MTDVSITPEDRERLAKSKFTEWFDELFSERFKSAFEEGVKAARAQSGGQQQQNGGQQQQNGGQQHYQEPARRRSLLETCLSDTFGF